MKASGIVRGVGGLAALYLAAAYLVGDAVLPRIREVPGNIVDPVEKVALLAGNRAGMMLVRTLAYGFGLLQIAWFVWLGIVMLRTASRPVPDNGGLRHWRTGVRKDKERWCVETRKNTDPVFHHHVCMVLDPLAVMRAVRPWNHPTEPGNTCQDQNTCYRNRRVGPGPVGAVFFAYYERKRRGPHLSEIVSDPDVRLEYGDRDVHHVGLEYRHRLDTSPILRRGRITPRCCRVSGCFLSIGSSWFSSAEDRRKSAGGVISFRFSNRSSAAGWVPALLGLIWAFWHLPSWFIPGTYQTYWNFGGFIILMLGYSFFYSWVMEASGRRPLAGMIVHGTANAFVPLFPVIVLSVNAVQVRYWIWVSLTLAIGIVFLGVKRRVQRHPERKEPREQVETQIRFSPLACLSVTGCRSESIGVRGRAARFIVGRLWYHRGSRFPGNSRVSSVRIPRRSTAVGRSIHPLAQDPRPRVRHLRHQHHLAVVQQPHPPMLEDLGLAAALIGFIMTWDNIINLFSQPWVGSRSDRTRTRSAGASPG